MWVLCWSLFKHLLYFFLFSFYIQLSGKSSLYIDTVKSDDDVKPEAEKPAPVVKNETENDTEAFLAQIEEETLLRTGKKKKLDRSQFGKYILNFGKKKTKILQLRYNSFW